jgi:serine/threonine-protein kinase
MRSALWIAAVTAALTGCSPPESGDVATTATPASGSAGVATTTTPDPRSKEALESAGHRLDVLAATRQDAQAWEYYSPRCQAEIGNLTQFSAVLDEFFRGRTPNYESATAIVNGSSGKVISVDSDPSAPASASLPRTWTFIDGRWQFDNC